MVSAAGCAPDRGLVWTQIESAEGDLVLLQVTIPTSSDDIIADDIIVCVCVCVYTCI
jgi:hypothetical protein